MAKWSGYQRFCSLARGLDLIGERWTLLIVQEISFGPIRYNDLRRKLPGIGSNILADRLRKLEAHNILCRTPAPVGRGVLYELTDRGMALGPALVELRKWGLNEQLMLDTPAETVTHDLSYGVPENAELLETYQWTVDGVVTTLRIEGTTLTQELGPADKPAVAISTTKAWMTDLVSGKTNWIQGKESGAVQVKGTAAAWERMLIATAQPGADLTKLNLGSPRSKDA